MNIEELKTVLKQHLAEIEEIDRMRSESVSTLNQANASNEDEIELLEKRIAELEAKVAEQKALVQHQHLWQEGEDAKERAHLERLVPVLKSRIDVLDAKIKKSLYFIRKLRMYCIYAHWDNPDTADEFNEFDAEVCEYLSEYKEREE